MKSYRCLAFLNYFLSKLREIILVCFIGIVTSYFECMMQFWSPDLAQDIAKLESVPETNPVHTSLTQQPGQNNPFDLSRNNAVSSKNSLFFHIEKNIFY